jgi:hypothetical protein
MKIMVLGDVHGRWRSLNELIAGTGPDIILQCGDFGYFPRLARPDGGRPNDPTGRLTTRARVHWCDGNHEDHETLAMLRENLGEGRRGSFEVATNVFWQDRGSTLTLPDGRVVLFMGGADSIDKKLRLNGRDWFPGELISMGDIMALPDGPVDIVISHTCPSRFRLPVPDAEKARDPSRKLLDEVFERYRPSLWYFGHWHKRMKGRYHKCRWTCLDKLTPMLRKDAICWLED